MTERHSAQQATMMANPAPTTTFHLGDQIKVKDFTGLVVDTELVGHRYATVTLAWRNPDGAVSERRFSAHLLARLLRGR